VARVLIADDEPGIVLAVRDELLFEGYEADVATTGTEALALARKVVPDALLLDLMLPGLNGFEVCRALRRERPDLWIIMLTVRGHEGDRVTGFEAGADDYVVKPFSLRELMARIRVGLRRARGREVTRREQFGAIEVDLAARRVLKEGEAVDLTPKEFDILSVLLRRSGEVVSRDEFLDLVWGTDIHVTHRTVDTHVSSLRRKLEADANKPAHIIGVRGIGYRLERTSTKS
jgi:DNA-binding response OmpR family regulator